MSSRYLRMLQRGKLVPGKAPSLVDLCVQTVIDNIRYLGNVGETDAHLLERILPHCTVDQLMHVEDETEGRDLSLVTDKLWKKFFEAKFGVEATKSVIERMKNRKVRFTWRQLYQAKLSLQEEVQKESVDRITQLYKEVNARKQSRQIKFTTKVPTETKKRSFHGGFGGGCNFSNTKSNIMKKAKIDYLNCQEFKNRVAMKKSVPQKSISASPSIKPRGLPGMHAPSTSKLRR
ncbi:hypothetical protein Ancab_007676 [Ancistrocladus abbreviatus]